MRLSSCSAPRGRRTRRRRNRLTLGRCEGSQLGHYDIITLLGEGGVGLNEGGTTLPDTPPYRGVCVCPVSSGHLSGERTTRLYCLNPHQPATCRTHVR